MLQLTNEQTTMLLGKQAIAIEALFLQKEALIKLVKGQKGKPEDKEKTDG